MKKATLEIDINDDGFDITFKSSDPQDDDLQLQLRGGAMKKAADLVTKLLWKEKE